MNWLECAWGNADMLSLCVCVFGHVHECAVMCVSIITPWSLWNPFVVLPLGADKGHGGCGFSWGDSQSFFGSSLNCCLCLQAPCCKCVVPHMFIGRHSSTTNIYIWQAIFWPLIYSWFCLISDLVIIKCLRLWFTLNLLEMCHIHIHVRCCQLLICIHFLFLFFLKCSFMI